MLLDDLDGHSSHSKSVRESELSDPIFERDGVRFATLYSSALCGRGDVSIFVPPQVETHSPVPIVFLLHGVYCSHWAWFFKGGAHRTALELITAGRIRPMILVAPSDGLFQDGSGYLRHSGRDYEAWIVVDVLNAVLRAFPYLNSNSPLFLAGLSMGGYGALRLGGKHAEFFRGISAHSAITTIEEMKLYLFEPFLVEQVAADEMDILHWFEVNRHLLPPLRLDCGIGDFLIEGNRRFHCELERRGIHHEYLEFEGAHTWEYWRSHFVSSLLFFEDILQR